MCGHYTYRLSWVKIRDLYQVNEPGVANMKARYNVAPTQEAPIVRVAANSGRKLVMARWGLVPDWSYQGKFSTINARAETVTTRPEFRGAFRNRRCLVPASDFFEWDDRAEGRQPWLYSLADGGTMTFAGLWDQWGQRSGQPALHSFAIVVCGATPAPGRKHDALPVILRPDQFDVWLTGTPGAAANSMRPYEGSDLISHPVSRRLNSARNDDPECIAPVTSQS